LKQGGAHYGLGLIEAKQGNDDKAIDYFKKSTGLEPGDIEAYLSLVEASFRMEQMQELEDYANELIKINKNNPNPYILLAYCYGASKNMPTTLVRDTHVKALELDLRLPYIFFAT